jgi:hypothetical protein
MVSQSTDGAVARTELDRPEALCSGTPPKPIPRAVDAVAARGR